MLLPDDGLFSRIPCVILSDIECRDSQAVDLYDTLDQAGQQLDMYKQTAASMHLTPLHATSAGTRGCKSYPLPTSTSCEALQSLSEAVPRSSAYHSVVPADDFACRGHVGSTIAGLRQYSTVAINSRQRACSVLLVPA